LTKAELSVLGRVMKSNPKISHTGESITSGQSGDCPVYLQRFILISAVHRPWSVSVHTINKTLLPIIKLVFEVQSIGLKKTCNWTVTDMNWTSGYRIR
jgi:hypothetical protein